MIKKKRVLHMEINHADNNTRKRQNKMDEYSIYNNNEESGSDIEEVMDEESSFELEPDQKKSTQQDRKNIEKLLDRLGLKTNNNGANKNQELQLVVNNFVQNCIETVDHDATVEQYDLAYDSIYQERLKTQEPYVSSIYISELTQLQSILKLKDKGIWAIYRSLMIAKRYTSMACERIVEHPIFEGLILVVIMMNSLKMATDDPLSTVSSLPWAQTTFTAIYVLQMSLKIIAYGFIFNKGSYLRDSWNIMDFSIVVTSLLPLIINLNFSVNALRAFRVLRPLRTITKIRALKMIMKTLFYSFSLVMDSIYILLFIIFVFAIAGMQLFGGNLKYRCMDELTGAMTSDLCSTVSDCKNAQICAKGIGSPNFSVINFDTLLWSALSVFQSITLEGWSQIMESLQQANGFIYCVYSLLIVFICEYVLLNMTMAILKYKYAQVKDNVIEEDEEEKQEYEPQFLRKIGVFNSISVLARPSLLVRANNSSKHQVGCSRTLPPKQIQSSVTVKELIGFLNQQKLSSKVIEPQNKFINVDQLRQLGKLAQYKWDAKQLQFQTNNLSEKQIQIDNIDEKPQSDKTLEGKEQEQSYLSDSDGQSDDDILSDSQEDQQIMERQQLIQTRAIQVQQKLNRGSTQPLQPSSKVVIEAQKNKEDEIDFDLKVKKPKTNVKQLSELDKLLSLIGSKTGAVSSKPPIIAPIPQIDLQSIVPQRVFQRFADLGDFSLKRQIKTNELKMLEIRAAQKKIHKESKRKQMPIQAAIQQSTLDLKELHLKNELQKKALRCRVKSDDIIDRQRRYDVMRVAISMRLREAEQKKEEIQENMTSLTFQVRYLPNSQKKQGKHTIFARNLQSEKLILKLPELTSTTKAQAGRQKIQKSSSQKSHGNLKYLRMLQNYQMEDRIELTLERVNATFFKPERQKKKQESNEQKNPADEYQQLYEQDILKRHGRLQLELPIQNLDEQSTLLSNLNMRKQEYDINIRGFAGFWRVARKQTLLFVSSPIYDNFILLVVMSNTILMSLSGFVNTDGEPYATINLVFNILFAIDLTIKVFAYGISFFSDIMNLFDSAVVVISFIQMMLGGSSLSALRSIRILRAFRVLRITRLIRSLSYMRIIMNVITSIINEFVYVFLLLFLFIFIFTLLGMQIFGGTFVPEEVSGIRQNFNTFFYSFFTIFQVMTVQNWNDIQTAISLSSVGPWGVIFLISWIFLGNWILLSLLQAILLDGFDDDSTNPQEETSGSDADIQSTIAQPIQQENSQEMASESEELSSQHSTKKDINYDAQDASLFIFKPLNPVRRFAIIVTNSTVFEVIMFIIILCSSGKLALDTYIDNDAGEIVQISQMIDYALNFIFIFQCSMKVIARGFIAGQDTYLKNTWNRLDFFIVCISIIDMVLSGINLSIIKLLRTLRPLRIITRNEEMKVMVTSLLQSIMGIFNLLIIVMCVYLMFAILGMNLLQNKLQYCNLQGDKLVTGVYGPYGIDQTTCVAQGGVWNTQLVNFENIASSMLSLYVFSTRQNWPFYVFTFIDSSESGPVKDNNDILYFIYAILFIFICSLFFMDLLIGVLFTNYHEAQAKICPQPLSDRQINWKNLQKLIIEEDPAFKLYISPQDPIRKALFNFVSTKAFEIGIAIIIIFNIFVMALNNDDIPQSRVQALTTLNSVCSFIFIFQLLLKLITFGRSYFLSVWNVFDFFVVSASILDLILHYLGVGSSQTSTLSLLPQIARIFRVLRITRLLRMLKRFKGLQKLIQTFVFSLPAIAKAFSILFLYLFICAILASNLMGQLHDDYSGNFNEILNYQDFHHAIQTLFVNLSGENWYQYMFISTTQGYAQCSGSECVSPFYYIFWLPFEFFGQKVFLQLFVLIVLDQFEANYINQHNPLGIFSLYEEDFREKWIQITVKYHSEKIQTKSLINLMLRLKPPLGLGRQQTLSKYKSQLSENDKITPKEIEQKMNELDQKLKKNAAILLNKMNLPKNRIYFGYHQTFYHFIKLATVPQFIADSTPAQLKLIEQMHKKSQEALDKLKPAGNLFYYGQLEEEDQLSVPLNPISLILFTQMIVKGWYNYSLRGRRRSKTKEDHYNHYDSLNDSCASDLNEAQYEKIAPQKRIAIRRGGLMESKMSHKCEFQPTNSITGAYEDGKRTKNRLSKSNRLSHPKNSVRQSNKVNLRNEPKKKTVLPSQEDSPK